MKLEVPYYSQFLDVHDEYWIPRACGICCMKMVFEYFGKDAPSVLDMAKLSEKEGGYGKSGLFHDYIVVSAKKLGLISHREEKMEEGTGIEKILSELKNKKPVIISAVKEILGQTKFHMVVLTGFEEEDGELSGFYFHDPEAVSRERGSYVFVPLGDFKKSWRKMAIFMAKK